MYSENYCVELGTRSVLEISGLDSVKLLQGSSRMMSSPYLPKIVSTQLYSHPKVNFYMIFFCARHENTYWIVGEAP
ncbi:MAG: hypothetical protein CM15mP62_07360 [Rhodospirillaceae bacterium]|nr:MAG: hypothetical protein CM15mP62_07360 [Rhodospirillaceae bacterium]